MHFIIIDPGRVLRTAILRWGSVDPPLRDHTGNRHCGTDCSLIPCPE